LELYFISIPNPNPNPTIKVRELAAHTSRVGTITWNSALLASGSRDRNIYLHDIRLRGGEGSTGSTGSSARRNSTGLNAGASSSSMGETLSGSRRNRESNPTIYDSEERDDGEEDRVRYREERGETEERGEREESSIRFSYLKLYPYFNLVTSRNPNPNPNPNPRRER
jgi:hypothetical protein